MSENDMAFAKDNLHSDQTCDTSNTESADSTQLLPRCRVALGKLLEGRVRREPGCRVRSLSGRSRNKALEEAPDTPLLEYQLATMQEAAHAWVGGLAVIDPDLSEPFVAMN